MAAGPEERKGSSVTNRALTQIEKALRGMKSWRGWTNKDRHLVEGVADSIAELNRRYIARVVELRRGEGSRHAR